MQDMVALKGMRFFTRVGVLPHEAELAQPVEVDLSVSVSAHVRPPIVVDYVALYRAVSSVMGATHISYLEEAAELIANAALATAGVRTATVSVRKPHVPLPGPVEYAEVTIVRENHE
ncbi:MAG: dihydroneopterin aldolase [Gemmatimonadaceae bacterium]